MKLINHGKNEKGGNAMRKEFKNNRALKRAENKEKEMKIKNRRSNDERFVDGCNGKLTTRKEWTTYQDDPWRN